MESACLSSFFLRFFLLWICIFPKNFDLSNVISLSFWIWNLVLPPWLTATATGSSDRDPTHCLRDQWTDSYAGTLLCELVMGAADDSEKWLGLVMSDGVVLLFFRSFFFLSDLVLDLNANPASLGRRLFIRRRPHPHPYFGRVS